MAGSSGVGALLRDLRHARGLTLAAAARKVGCAESQLSYVESGRRTLHRWLANELDRLYATGGVLAGLAHCPDQIFHDRSSTATMSSGVLTVPTSDGGTPMPLSRRDILAYLGTGALTGSVQGWLDAVNQCPDPDYETLNRAHDALASYQAAGRVLPAHQVVNTMTGQVALLDATRRRASQPLRLRFLKLQAQYAESLSWFSEEAGNSADALFWTDRAAQWAHSCDWAAMTGYTLVRRSMMALSFHGDSARAVEEARFALEHPRIPARTRGLAAKQEAFGHALGWQTEASERALDESMNLLSQHSDDEGDVGQHSVVDDDLYAIFRTTCDIYRGQGAQAIATLEPKLTSLSKGSARTTAITRAKLAHAYANVGQPHEATWHAVRALDAHESLQSHSTCRELRRALPVLAQWRQYTDVHNVMQRIRQVQITSA